MSQASSLDQTPTNDLILLTERQASERLGYSPRALQQWRRTGAGPKFVRVSARSVRYRLCDLHEWIEVRVRTSTSDLGPAA